MMKGIVHLTIKNDVIIFSLFFLNLVVILCPYNASHWAITNILQNISLCVLPKKERHMVLEWGEYMLKCFYLYLFWGK